MQNTVEMEQRKNNCDIVLTKPVRGLLREVLYYLVDDGDDEPMIQWISAVSKYMDVPSSIKR